MIRRNATLCGCVPRRKAYKERGEAHRPKAQLGFLPFVAMDATSSSQCPCVLSTYLLGFFLLSSLLTAVQTKESFGTNHTVEVSSLLPSASCKISATKDDAKTSSLKVVHNLGPCVLLANRSNPSLQRRTHADILREDQSRVNSINARLTSRTMMAPVTGPPTWPSGKSGAEIPARPGSTVGSGNYVVTVGLGTPRLDLSLMFDTGSDLTWTQCEPCLGHCYEQVEPIFDSTASTSYANISCATTTCSQLTSATGINPGCSSSTCVYDTIYGDSSRSVGFFGKEKLTLTPRDVIDNFMFGCGQNNIGLFSGAAGILGLGRDKLSIVEQTAKKYGRHFSYCLPSSTSSTGHLTFGMRTKSGAFVKFTPLSTTSLDTSFYGITIEAITVHGKKLPIPESVFSDTPAIIDSGTVITRLPPAAYAALRSAFRQQMAEYPAAPALAILDTCYDLSEHSSVTIPRVGFTFSGNTYIDLDATGIVYVETASRVCLAFAANSDDKDVLIYGNVQQRTFEVVYDVGGKKLGFGARGCA